MIKATEDGNSLDATACCNSQAALAKKRAKQNENTGMRWNLEPLTPVKTQGKDILEAWIENLLAFREICFFVTSREVVDAPSELPQDTHLF